MSNEALRAPPMTQKAQRKMAAADVRNSKIFRRTEFGRKRIASFPLRFMRGFILVLGVPFACVYGVVRGTPPPSKFQDWLKREGRPFGHPRADADMRDARFHHQRGPPGGHS